MFPAFLNLLFCPAILKGGLICDSLPPLLLFLFSLSASAQDTSAWTTHPDEDQTKLMNYFAMGNAQANGQAQSAQAQILQNQHNLDMAKLRQDQIAMEQAQRQSQAALPITRAPYLSVGSGAVAPETAVQVRSPNHAAFLFYTTDGWTPTTASPRYKDVATRAPFGSYWFWFAASVDAALRSASR